MDRGAWQATSPWSHKRAGHDLATKQQQRTGYMLMEEAPQVLEGLE